MNKKLDPKANNHGRLLLVFLVILMSVLVMLPSGCLDSDEDKQEDPGAQSVTPDKDPTVPPKPTDDDNDDIPVKVTDDDKPEDVSTSQVIKRSFSSGGSSRSSSSSPAPSSPDVSRTIDSGDYTESLRTITGDLTITGATDGTITLPANLTVNGDLIVDTPNATVTNRANIGGTITINAVSVNTWNQYGNARSIQMGAENATINFFAGDVPQGIKLTKPSRLVINASSGLPNVTVTGDAQDSDIDNLGGGELNLTAEANVTVAGNVNVTGNVTVTERTARGSLTLNPTSAVYNTNVDMIVTYTAGENLTTGVVNITVPTEFAVADINGLTIAGAGTTVGANANADYDGNELSINNVDITKGQKIVLTLATKQKISSAGTYEFAATATNTSKLISNAATARFISLPNNDADLSALVVSPGALIPTFDAATTAYAVNVAYDVSSINLTATLSDTNASILINDEAATSAVLKSVILQAAGESTPIPVVVTAEDETTTKTYTVTVNRAVDPTINIAAISGLTVPATGETPVTTITETAQYTGSVSWSPDNNPFVGNQEYTATITLTPKAGFSLTGVTENFFEVADATSFTNDADSGIVTATFPATEPAVIDIAAISGLTVPATGETPVTTITETAQYTGSVSWSPDNNPFAGEQEYTAIISLEAKPGYTFEGVEANFFTVEGATITTNVASSGEVSAVFSATANTDADLSALTVGTGRLDPAFDKATTAYDVDVAYDVESIDVTATLSDTNASLLINGTEATSNVAEPVSLNASGQSTSIDVVVTAEDGETTETYTVTVIRAAGPEPVVLGDPTPIAFAASNPMTTLSISGTNFTAEANDTANWVIDTGTTSLDTPVITLQDEGGMATSLTINFNGTAAEGTITFKALNAALVADQDSNEVSLTISDTTPDYAWDVHVTDINNPKTPINARFNLYSDSEFENPASLTESLAKDSTTVYASMINQLGTTYYTVVLNRTVDNSGWDVIVETDNINNNFAAYIVTTFNETTVSLYSDAELESSTSLDSILTNETGYIKVTAKDDSVTSYKVTITRAAASTDATVSSADYAIDSTAATIAGVPDGTDVTVFKDKLTHRTGASLEVYQSDETTVRSGNVVTGDVVIVTAEDATTTKTYTVTVVSPLSTDATVSSGDYAIDSTAATIAGVPDGTDVTVFKGNLTHRTGASLEVYESDGKTERSGNVVTGDVVIVTAEDTTTTKTYTVTVK